MAANRALLRLAARDVRRAPARSLIVVLMVALPVMAAVAIAVIAQTSRVPVSERVDRLLGRADAAITTSPTAVAQGADPDNATVALDQKPTRSLNPTTIRQILGPVAIRASQQAAISARSTAGILSLKLEQIDLRSGISAGRWDLRRGRFPRSAGEAVLSEDLVNPGLGIGGRIEIGSRSVVVVGVVRNGTTRKPDAVVAFPGSVPMPRDTPWTYYVSGRSVTWAQIRALNADGGIVTSRTVLLHPPSTTEIPFEARMSSTPLLTRTAVVAAALVVTMALLEVVLLAGPAFAVTARRQSRMLAMLSAAGATRRQRRAVVLGTGLVLGAASSVVGVIGGIAAAKLMLPAVQSVPATWFGSFRIPVPIVLLIAVFGLASALVAAFVPAWLAGREDVVLVLAGRRGEQAPRARTPIFGLLLMGLGVVSAVAANTSTALARQGLTTVLLPLAALLTVVGALFVTPLALGIVAQLSGRLPLALRYAARDSIRHRLRTIPAIAAVAATAAGAVTAGMAISSEQARSRADYTPTIPLGLAAVTVTDPASAGAIQRMIERTTPGASVTPVIGLASPDQTAPANVAITYGPDQPAYGGWGGPLNAQILVADRLPDYLLSLTPADRNRGNAILHENGIVVFAQPDSHRRATVTYSVADATGREVVSAHASFRSTTISTSAAPAMGLLSPAAASRLGIHPVTTAFAIAHGTWDPATTRALNAQLGTIASAPSLYVERGPQDDSRGRAIGLVILILACLVAAIGTLTATSLSLSDARPDLATLSAVGASRLTRRMVAASFALLIGGIGAVLGVVVGLVPGIALAYRLTERFTQSNSVGVSTSMSHYVVMPWSIILAVLALPLLVGLLVAATTGARLPIRARVD